MGQAQEHDYIIIYNLNKYIVILNIFFLFLSFVDFINVMAYDYHSYQWYFPMTGPNSPLFSPRDESGYFQNLNINTTIQYWISKGMPKEKILLGMPTYGHSFT